MPRKTEFYLTPNTAQYRAIKLEIAGRAPNEKVEVLLHLPVHGEVAYLAGTDLERFAVNILKALNSKKLAK